MTNNNINLDKGTVKRYVAYIALNLFGIYIIYLLSEFITPFLGAVTFFVLFKNMMVKLTDEKKWNPSAAAALIILLSFVIILLPILTLSYMLYEKVQEVFLHQESFTQIFASIDMRFYELTGNELFTQDAISGFQNKIANAIPSILGQGFYLIGHIAIMYFVLFYMLVSRQAITKEINNYLPFDLVNIRLLAEELENMTLSNAIGVPLIGIIQGTAAGIGYAIFGLSDPVFWGVITAFVSLLPVVGTTLIWAPAGVYLLATVGTWQGIGMLIYGILVIINIDNIARFIIQKRFADVHPMITIFGVIIGLNLFGLPGLIFGPLMLSYFVLFVKMYRKIYIGSATDSQSN